MESYGGDVNTARTSYYNGNVSAGSTSSNNTTVDPTAILVVTETTETFSGTESISVDTFSSNNFTGTSYTHTAGSKF